MIPRDFLRGIIFDLDEFLSRHDVSESTRRVKRKNRTTEETKIAIITLPHLRRVNYVLDEQAELTVTLTIRSVLRVGSVLAGTVSVSWGAYIVQASAALWKSGPTPNPFTSSDFLTLSMYEAILVGLFALVLAILSR